MEQFKNFSSQFCFCFRFSFFFSKIKPVPRVDSRKFLATLFFLCFFVFLFFFLSISLGNWTASRVDSLKFLVTIFFFFFFSSYLYSYIAHDSSKKWQEILNQLGLISQIVQLQNFLSLLCFLFNKWKGLNSYYNA